MLSLRAELSVVCCSFTYRRFVPFAQAANTQRYKGIREIRAKEKALAAAEAAK
jgi:hypothetical protein